MIAFPRLSPSDYSSPQRQHRQLAFGLLLTTLTGVGLLRTLPALAQTAPGTAIENTAEGSYTRVTDPVGTPPIVVESNTVVVTIAEVAGITVTSNGYQEAPSGVSGAGPNQGVGGFNPGDVVYFDFVMTNVGNDPTQFFIPGVVASLSGGTQAGDIQVIEYDPDGTGTAAVDLTGNNITTSAGASTGTLLNGVTNTNNGSVPIGGTVTVRVPVTITAAVGDSVSITLGNTDAPPDNQNQPYQSAGGDVYTVDNAGTDNGDVTGAPANGEREASDSQSLTVELATFAVNGTVFGDHSSGTLSNDANDTIDAGESGIGGVTVTLYTDWVDTGDGIFQPGEASLVGTTASDPSDGTYEFIGLTNNTYYALIETSDPDLGGQTYGGANNPLSVVVNNADATADFPFDLFCAASDTFPVSPLTHTGTGSNSTTLTFASPQIDPSFQITNIDQVTGGNPGNRYIEEVTITYVDGDGVNQTYGTFSAASVTSVTVNISGVVQSITVALTDGQNDGTGSTMSVNLSGVGSCNTVPLAIQGTVFEDYGSSVGSDEGNDSLNSGEAGIGEISVTLYNNWVDNGDGILQPAEATQVATTTSDSGSGVYSFPNVSTGTYHVVVDEADGDLAGRLYGGTDNPITVTVASSNEIVDFPFDLAPVFYDYGDAPDTYGTDSTANNSSSGVDPVGASHILGGGLYLGTVAPDSEADAATPLDGTGDGAEDDGVTLPASIEQGSTFSLPVTVTGSGNLSAWIDWDGNGTFDAGEEIATDAVDGGAGDTDSTAGTITLSVTAPAGATVGNTFARFRFSSDAGLGATGPATDGEVEDYQVAIAAAVASNPNVQLVKRITAINGDRTQNPNDNTPLNAIVNDGTANSSDDEANWPANYLLGEINAGSVNPGDDIEYTVYYLNAGALDAEDVRICDWIQPNQSVVTGLYSGDDIELQTGEGTGSNTYTLTTANDAGDRAQLATVDALPPGPTCNLPAASAGTTDDVLVLDITGTTGNPSSVTTTLPGSTAPGTPDEAFGFFRFTTKVNE